MVNFTSWAPSVLMISKLDWQTFNTEFEFDLMLHSSNPMPQLNKAY